METFPPLAFDWNGEHFTPIHPRRADRFLVVGERYMLAPIEERSDATHKHEFAWLRDAWANLPESLADLYATPEHLRKRALIDGGFYNETIIDAGTNAAALRVASAVRARSEFSLVIVRGPAVVIRDAKSQSRRSMKRDEFQRSKTAILEIVSAMIGVTPETLSHPSQLPLEPAARPAPQPRAAGSSIQELA